MERVNPVMANAIMTANSIKSLLNNELLIISGGVS